ncbi:MAG: hypothetical protein IT256_02960 [Chitinophagaceae bacterium]|nr:hypothetical protein [Chitinophagaceae bacterium]
MKHYISLISTAIILATLLPSCRKKTDGVCYCHYLSGDKKEYNLSSFTRSQQQDSCYVLDQLALNFAGDCDLK